MAAPTDLASMVAEIKGRIYANGVGGITAATLQTVLLDTLNVLDAIAANAAITAASAVINLARNDTVAAQILTYPTTMPATPGTLWWDGGVLARTDGDPPTSLTIAYGAAVDARLLSYPTTLPAQPGQLWWDGGVLACS